MSEKDGTKKEGFKLPDNYFDELQDKMKTVIPEDADMIDLEQEAPTLLKLGKKEGFVLPANYFDKIQEKTNSILSGDVDLINIAEEAPTLFNIGKKEGFVVADDYFEQSRERILEIKEESPETAKLIKMPNWIKYAAAAASLTLCAYLINFNLDRQVGETETLVNIDEIESTEEEIEEIYAYLETNLESILDEELHLDDDEDLLEDYDSEEIDQLIDEYLDDIELSDIEEYF